MVGEVRLGVLKGRKRLEHEAPVQDEPWQRQERQRGSQEPAAQIKRRKKVGSGVTAVNEAKPAAENRKEAEDCREQPT